MVGLSSPSAQFAAGAKRAYAMVAHLFLMLLGRLTDTWNVAANSKSRCVITVYGDVPDELWVCANVSGLYAVFVRFSRPKERHKDIKTLLLRWACSHSIHKL